MKSTPHDLVYHHHTHKMNGIFFLKSTKKSSIPIQQSHKECCVNPKTTPPAGGGEKADGDGDGQQQQQKLCIRNPVVQ